MDDAITDGFDRHPEHVFRGLEYAGYLDREAALARVQCACCDQPVVAVDQRQDLRLVETVALHPAGIDDDLHQFLANADQGDLENAGDAFNFFLEVACDRRQRTLGDIAREVENQHRIEAGELDLGHCRLFGLRRQFGLGRIDLGARILQRDINVGAGIEANGHARAALVGIGGDFVDTLDRPDLLLHGPDEQTFGILGRDPVMRHADVDHRDVDVRFCFLRYADIGHDARDDDHRERHHDGARAAHGCLDDLHA